MRNSVILIPTLNPTEMLLNYIQELISNGFNRIIVVDDGSSNKEARSIFERIDEMEQCRVVHHAINLGKGRALKTGINYYLNSFSDAKGILTVDSDGQHLVKNVIDLDDKLSTISGEGVVLGCRNFDLDNVPFKSRFGNKCTSFVFKLLYGIKISDTQTGLRAMTKDAARIFLDLQGERFEYETNMLIKIRKENVPLYEVPIDTVYINGNSETHFDPIRDSLKIYGLLLGEFFKYTAVSLGSFVLDIALFQLLIILLHCQTSMSEIFLATVGARVCSSIFNCTMNYHIVFKSTKKRKRTVIRYYALCVVQMVCSALLVTGFVQLMNFPEAFVKVVVDMLLFVLSYYVQKQFVF